MCDGSGNVAFIELICTLSAGDDLDGVWAEVSSQWR